MHTTILCISLLILYQLKLTSSFTPATSHHTTRVRYRTSIHSHVETSNQSDINSTDSDNDTIRKLKELLQDGDSESRTFNATSTTRITRISQRKDSLVQKSVTVSPSSLAVVGTSLAYTGILSISSFYLSNQWQDLLQRYEWFQSYRYFWCLIGVFYIIDSVLSLGASTSLSRSTEIIDDGKSVVSEDSLGETIQFYLGNIPNRLKVLTGFAGISLVIGGAADAFLPVYVTGPNLITAAGLAPDSAAFLMTISLALFTKETIRELSAWNENRGVLTTTKDVLMNDVKTGRFTGTVLLLSQLYILGCGTFDEIASNMMG